MDTTVPDPIAAARASENFPVASRLIAPALRPAVLAFYRVARGADDIADDPALDPAIKEARLRALDAVLDGGAPDAGWQLSTDAGTLREICRRHAVDVVHPRHLLQAFIADAVNRPCRSWSDLIAYCRFSAAPVGRFLLELHGELPQASRASDALCTALQILNHIQDCQADWRRLQRCYVPLDWLGAEGLAPDALLESRTSPALRRVFDRMLDKVDLLLAEARPLAGIVHDRGLAAESAGIVAIAIALARALRRGDPLAGRVALRTSRKLGIAALAAIGQIRRRSRSSFALSIRLFPAGARRVIAAIYALARRLDDIVDGPAPLAAKHAAMASWQEEISRLYAGVPQEPLTIALRDATPSLPKAEFEALIDGLAMDAGAPIHAPERTDYKRYCRGVAGAVGVLVLAACGRTSEADRDFAIQLGEAFQTVNVLRDIDEDAARGRLYVPADVVRRAGLDPSRPLAELLADVRFGEARRLMVGEAVAGFEAANTLAASAPGARIFAVRLMTATYRRMLTRLARRPEIRPRLGWRDHCSALAAALRGAA
jgi:hydroxysqualene synthase